MKNIAARFKRILGLRKRHPEPLPFDVLFRLFKEVLDKDNRALESITDMGDKLGGDYLFDIAYVKAAYSELSSSVRDSQLTFDLLTQKKYPGLGGAIDRIDGLVKKMVYDLSASGEMVVFYQDISWDMIHDVGGKNANLAEVRNYLRLRVPEAFVITTHAFDIFLRRNGIDKQIRALKEDDLSGQRLSQLRDSVIAAQIPSELETAVEKALEEMRGRCGGNCSLAVRSSAEEEDADFSFAGQFETRLNVPSDSAAVLRAYKEVVASLFSQKAVSYQRQLGYPIGNMKMAVGCMTMVDAETSGVIYSSHQSGDRNTLLINAGWGLGSTIVEGRSDADVYILGRGSEFEIVDMKAGDKEFMATAQEGGGIETANTPDELRTKKTLSPQQAEALWRKALLIEKHFKKPQDIEWAIDRNGELFILQARPLRMDESADVSLSPSRIGLAQGISREETPGSSEATVYFAGRSTIVQRGIGAGKVFIVKRPEELDLFPRGAVLVAVHDSSDYVRVMPYVSAVITDVGTPTSHMASLCREFRVPTIVNAGDATKVLVHGQEITVDAEDEANLRVYEGIRREVIERASARSAKMEDLHEFRKKRYILRYVSPLNLVDPLMDNFSPEGCKTMHDVIRFIHEKAVAELVECASSSRGRKQAAVKLDIPIPAGIMVVDMGGGLDTSLNPPRVTYDQVTSIPFRAILKGMTHPGVWRSEAVSLKVHDFLSSMMRMSDITADGGADAGYNLAVVTGEYVNLSIRFGYHFTILDCYCSETIRNNHIYFRFAGGATDITKRSRRLSLIASVLKEYGFNIKTQGDLLIARLSNLGREEIEVILDQLGRLIAYTRQLDAVMYDDSAVEIYVRDFLEEKYGH